ncbi:unnamed protein product, partial [Musa hybrid cultivar]
MSELRELGRSYEKTHVSGAMEPHMNPVDCSCFDALDRLGWSRRGRRRVNRRPHSTRRTTAHHYTPIGLSSISCIFSSSATPSHTSSMATIIDGKAIARCFRNEIAVEVPGLAVVIVGVRKDSQSYVSMKRKSCAEVGIRSIDVDFPEQISGVDVVAKVHELNDDPDVHGSSSRSSLFSTLLVISDDQELVPTEKDVDGFHPLNFGKACNEEQRALISARHSKGI